MNGAVGLDIKDVGGTGRRRGTGNWLGYKINKLIKRLLYLIYKDN